MSVVQATIGGFVPPLIPICCVAYHAHVSCVDTVSTDCEARILRRGSVGYDLVKIS